MRRVWLSSSFAVIAAAALTAQGAATPPDISGFWELRYDSFNVPRAILTASAAAEEAARARADIDAIATCQSVGLAALMADRAPIDIRQSPSVIGIVAKLPSAARYIYTDGRPHPPLDEYDPTTNGHSVGRWQGDSLVVTTVGLSDRGVRSLPGGGFRTAESRLTERYRLLNDGQRLSVTFTWEDPKVFQQPHTYEFRYYRVKDTALPRVYQCNPADPERTTFLKEAPQPVTAPR
jgi:hypothetical protein